MSNKTITIEILKNMMPTGIAYKAKLIRCCTYYLEIPREDLRTWADARIKVTVDYTKDKQ